MSDPNQIFIRERLSAGVSSSVLSPEVNALYTNAGPATGALIESFQPLVAAGSTTPALGRELNIPNDDMNNIAVSAIRTLTTDVLAVSKSRRHKTYPLTGGVAVAQGLMGSLGPNAQDAVVTGVYNMEIDQGFVNADTRLFVVSRQDGRQAFSTAERGALEWTLTLPAIQGSGSDDVRQRLVFVRQDATTITVQWAYRPVDQTVSFDVHDGAQSLLSTTASLTNRFGVVADPVSQTLAFYLEGTYVVSAPLNNSDQFEMVALFEQRNGIYTLNPLARFHAELVVDEAHFVHDYNAPSLTLTNT